MNDRQKTLAALVDRHREEALSAERWLWAHPQTGYTEWEADGYLSSRFEEMGYSLTRAGNIPGFYTDIDTGKPGPTIAVMGELDALDIANHPESVNGMTHCCGHHAQGAAMLPLAHALKEESALDGLCGKIRLMLVPAEEMIQLPFRESLIKKGVIKYLGGKVEFMRRGYFDGVDISVMVHGSTDDDHDFACGLGSNGCLAKVITYTGKSAHAGGSPQKGINAQYAATLGLDACNALRETFPDEDRVRFHPILKGVNCAVNIIPDEMVIESYVRGRTLEAMRRENAKINRALTGAALAMGAKVRLRDMPGYAPENHDLTLMRLAQKACEALVGKERVSFDEQGWGTGSSDFGDLTKVMPGVQFNCSGASGTGHGTDYCVSDPDKLVLNSAKAQLLLIDMLLSGGAAEAKKVIEGCRPEFGSIAEYLNYIDGMDMDKDAVKYTEDGGVIIDCK